MVNEKLKNRESAIANLMNLDLTIQGFHYSKSLKGVLDTECTLIKADNLLALSVLCLQEEVKVDFCYIDPPYNTGSSFVYDDKMRINRGGIWGRHHDWMAFMLPRLIRAHHLLCPDGVIAISIDDYEYAHLKILMDCIFEEKNYIATLVVCRSKNGKGGKANVAVNHEYVLIYGKSSGSLLHGIAERNTEKYDREDEHGKYAIDGLFRKKGDASLREDRPNMFYPLYCSVDGTVYTEKTDVHLREVWPVDSKGIERRWLWGKNKATSDAWKLYASKGGIVYVKNYTSDSKRIKIRSIFDKLGYLTDRATIEIKQIYGEKVFETPKPIELIKDLIECCSGMNAVVLDFFAGTGTTAEGVHELNKNTNASRKVILVEQPYPIDFGHTAKDKGFEKISDITEFRLKMIQRNNIKFQYSIFEL